MVVWSVWQKKIARDEIRLAFLEVIKTPGAT
jgi:hypothetical protein